MKIPTTITLCKLLAKFKLVGRKIVYIFHNLFGFDKDSLQQKVSMYAKWFHWILNEFISCSEWDQWKTSEFTSCSQHGLVKKQ
jgi:hypothetical protein